MNGKSLLIIDRRSSSLTSSSRAVVTKFIMSLALSIVLLVLIASWLGSTSGPMVAEARPSALVSKKPPFNGSIFGKRSGPPPITNQAPTHQQQPPVQMPLGYDPLYLGANKNNLNNLDANNNFITSLYQQQDVALLKAALNRCLLQRELLEAGKSR